MQSKMSLFNREMILQVGRSVGWISIIYFLVLFFAVPLRMMMDYSGENFRTFMTVRNMFQFEFEIQFIMLITVPVVLSVFLYRFLHVRQAADLMHSLPLKREQIYHFYTLTGIVYLIVPVLLNALIAFIVHSIYDLSLFINLSDIWKWAGTVILYNLVFYIAGVFLAMLTGISVVHGVLTYILLLFPAGFTLLALYNLGMMLYGFPNDYYQIRNLEYLSPISHLTLMESKSLTIQEIALYILLLIIFYFFSLFIYKKRKVEAASEAIAFRSLKSIFKYGVAFCMMLLGGMYFDAMQNKFAWLLFGYAAGGIIGYYTAEMILQKSWRVFGRIRGLAYFAISMVLVILVIQSFAPYEKRVPALNDIKSVTYTNTIYVDPDERLAPKPLFNKENIKAVRKLHADIIRNEKTNEQDMKSGENVLFIYELENGRKMVRQYSIDRFDYETQLKAIYESQEYKHSSQAIFKIKNDEVRSLRITNYNKESFLTFSDKEKIDQVMTLLKKDIEQESFTVEYYPIGNRSNIEIMVGPVDSYHVDLKHDYQNIITWLRDQNMLDQAMVMPEDLEYILVTDERIKPDEFKEYPEEEIMNKILNDQDNLKIEDGAQIKIAMEKAGYGWFNETPYTAIFVYKNNSQREIRTFTEKDVPVFIKEHFEKR
ncbi:DUF6449 domain-containing protein [Mesobacillus subterraneus]|uniref:Multidrug ABC transporter permease n=1 Tax=Mesobacillus subterraneus TaxID=285983 RepID=A0A427TM66_9BACI|nr:DUF6449 domain-containing protein [Mesobacillus subterraneus]RSD25450.1 multidrug ABC transporter permease [Mesobacillus subterraneus]